MIYRRIQIGGTGWRGRIGLIVAMALGLGLATGLIILAFGLALLLLPVVAVASLIGWLRWRRLMADALRSERSPDPERPGSRVIDTDYKVIGREDGGGARTR